MSISVKCPNGHKLVLKDEHAGKKVRCPKCKVVMRAPRGRWEVAPTLSEATSVERPVLMCAAGHRFLVLTDHQSDQVRCPLCDQPAGVPVSATVLNANGQTIVAEAPGLTAPMAVAAFTGSQASVVADAGPSSPTTVASPPSPVSAPAERQSSTLAPIAPAAPLRSEANGLIATPSLPDPKSSVINPYEVAAEVPQQAADVDVAAPVAKEKLWPLFLIVGGAVATLVGIAFWLKQSQGQ